MEKSLKEQLVVLPTHKPHISFSEYSTWAACSYRHKLEFVDGLGESASSAYLTFGSVQHKCCENLMAHDEPNIEYGILQLEKAWSEHPEFEQQISLSDAKRGLIEITPEIKPYFDATFPGWKWVASEHVLYEQIEDTPHAFKGFIDLVIEVPVKKKKITWLVDWKSCAWGWGYDKKNNPITQRQLVFYKKFYAEKMGLDIKDMRCGFVLLKRTAKPGQRIELIPVSAGELTIERATKQARNMLSSLKKGIALKNRESCKWCPFNGTDHCT